MAKAKVKRDKVLTSSALAVKYAGSGLASKIILETENSLWLPSRNIPLNYAMGGGIPYGKILEIFGEESSGKTLAAIDFAFVCQSLGGEIIWNDAEQAFTAHWAIQNGLDLNRIHLYGETSVEYVSDWLADTVLAIRARLKNNEPIVFIQDSIAALDCLANINSSQIDDKAEMGNRAKAIYKMVRIRNQMMAELGVICIYINQIRKKVGATKWEDPDSTPGGMAMRFFASQRMGMYAGRQIKEKIGKYEERVGVEASIRIKKNKVAPPKPTFKAMIYFNPNYTDKPIGYDRYAGLAEVLMRTGVVDSKPGSSMIYYKGNLIARGEDSFQRKLTEDEELRSRLIRKSGINTVSQTRKKLEGLTSNLFPVKTTKVISQIDTPDEDE